MSRSNSLFVIVGTLCLISKETVFAAVDYSCLHASAWRVNSGHYNSIFSTNTEVKSSTKSGSSWSMVSYGIPDYDRTFTAADVAALNSRPNAATDFRSNSETTAVAGTSYVFGEDINYKQQSCDKGYWPPGPSCPESASLTSTFSLLPAKESSTAGCSTGLGAMVTLVNGAAYWNWGDGKNYNSQGVWYNVAPVWEFYDIDPCGGHAAGTSYHHHFHTACLAEKLGDTGTGHSVLYGFGPDGFPIYGPYQASGVLAKSSWGKRDYSGVTGCTDGTRSCKLVNNLDYTEGTTTVTSGPSLTSTQTSQSGNAIAAVSGIYFEDYYYNSTMFAKGGEYLDEHNGHDHDNYGWHYHFTVDSTATATFPYGVGPKYYGCVDTDSCSTSTCSTTAASSSYQCLTAGSTTTSAPTVAPTAAPSNPTFAPTSGAPTMAPTSAAPTIAPTAVPTAAPTTPTVVYSVSQTISGVDVATALTASFSVSFSASIATTLSIQSSAVNITGATLVSTRRGLSEKDLSVGTLRGMATAKDFKSDRIHLQATSVSVAYTVSAQATTAAAITSTLTSSTTTLSTALTTSGFTVTSVGTPTASTFAPTSAPTFAPSSVAQSSSTKLNSFLMTTSALTFLTMITTIYL